MMNNIILKLQKISKVYGKKNSIVNALNYVDLEIEENDYIAIIGPSGSGKTTLMNIIGLIDKCDSGIYLIKDKNVNELSKTDKARLRNQKFGFVVQNFALINEYSVYENIKLPCVYAIPKMHRNLIDQKIDIYLKKVNLSDKKNELVENLSRGQKQRVAIARALINDPDIILADEPTGALDMETTKQIMKIFDDIHKDGKTIIMITHNLDIAKRCNKVAKMVDGKLSLL